MKTLQEHYNAIQNGKGGNKAQFLRQARQLFPQYINQYSDFDTATRVLKSKQVISEANAGGVVSKGFDIFDWKKILAEEVKAEEKETSKEVKDANKNAFQPSDMKNADNINFNEIMKGFYAELKDEKNHNKTAEEIKAMVVKNLAKDPLYYTKDGEFGTKGVGYTVDAPGLGEPKEPKGKHKSSGYGDLDTDKKVEKVKANVQDSLGEKEAKTSNPSKVKEMEITPQNSKGVKKMKMPGAEKKIKLKENKEDSNYDDKIYWIENEVDYVPDEIEVYEKWPEPYKTKALKALEYRKKNFNQMSKDKLDSLKENKEKLSQYDNMSDEELIQWAKEDGMGDFIEYDEVGELSNRRELLSVLLGKELEYDNEHGDFDYDTRDQEWDDDDLDPAGGRGLSSHLEENQSPISREDWKKISQISYDLYHDAVKKGGADSVMLDDVPEIAWLVAAGRKLGFSKEDIENAYFSDENSISPSGERIYENINKKYTHFAVRKSDNKIVNGWETISDVDSLKYYAKMDLKDIFPDSKISDFIIYSKNALIKKGIDPFDIKNWESYKADKVDETDIHGVAGNPDEEIEYKKAQIKTLDPISAQIADLEQELMSTTDPDRKAEIELKIKELQSGLQEEKLRVLIREIIKEEITKR